MTTVWSSTGIAVPAKRAVAWKMVSTISAALRREWRRTSVCRRATPNSSPVAWWWHSVIPSV